ncbi:MAG: flippase-like domain-containing protein [Patescibacteria group bacterium]|nr:flippase-like domain-containing protein [Patescibacteria group bacterium]
MSKGKDTQLVNWLKKHKRLIVSLATLVLIILIVIFIDFLNILKKISMIGVYGTFLFIILYTSAFLLRAYKLKLIFKCLDQPIKFSLSYFSVGASFLINDITPGQIGDIVKVFILKEQEDIGLSESFTGIAIERVVDFLLLFSINFFALIYLYLTIVGELENRIILGQNLQFYLFLGVVLIIIVLILLLVLFYKQDFILKIIKKISKKLYNYIDRFLTNFKNGLYKFKDHKKEFFCIILLNIQRILPMHLSL